MRGTYKPAFGVTQMAKSNIQVSDYLGGVTMFNRDTFIEAGGYHNDYFHRAEDNEMRFNLKGKGIPVLYRFAVYQQLPHTRTGPEFIPELWEKAKLPRKINMLETCSYKLISKEVKEGYTHLRVLL
jgi:GT2 family glycosyltransferase